MIVNLNVIIIFDKGIYKKVIENGIDSLFILLGFIKLEEFNYGFIGGCGGLISNNFMVFNGDILMYLDYLSIKNFFKKYNIEILNVVGL